MQSRQVVAKSCHCLHEKMVNQERISKRAYSSIYFDGQASQINFKYLNYPNISGNHSQDNIQSSIGAAEIKSRFWWTFILNATSALDTLTIHRCPNQGAAPSVPYSHCEYDPQIPCPGNSASDRGLWCQCDICTDPEAFVPYTGVTRYYNFSINAT